MPTRRAVLQCGPQPPAAEARKRAPQAASEIIHNAFSCKTFARAGCRGRACGREPAPGARSSVSEREQSLRDMLAIIVILSEADRRTQRVQRPLADYASQGGERQTKCSQESMTNDKESDSSSVDDLLRMTNCALCIVNSELFFGSAADWNMQLAATRGGKWEWLFGLFASVPASGASRIHRIRSS